jgi:ABC-type bacteriocin/lantibiotic exporter with double-glycine peptidase domain
MVLAFIDAMQQIQIVSEALSVLDNEQLQLQDSEGSFDKASQQRPNIHFNDVTFRYGSDDCVAQYRPANSIWPARGHRRPVGIG